MDPDFWHQRWREGRIGFHQDTPTPLLLEHWPALALAPGSQVFVPLAGKSLDLVWLAAQGHRVLGVELSPLAVAQFFDEHGLTPQVHDSRYGRHYRAGDIELICGDVFGLDVDALVDCAAVYDRAALIALPPPLRRRYVRELHALLPVGCRGLLITLEYPPHEKQGPPFAVPEAEVRELYGHDWDVTTLERRDILVQQPGFVAEGVSALETVVYRLSRR
ncbi:thiopurine S-methyltransferase [Rhodanobacter panaciterrae]|uniref:Thiopurine S-methyltransferase n=1 Tax=Rhodanobacter panaciterrae TaxID=490572 RepID=A0ABQ2ZH55_9GAMM|nr:thiopurine S-methyltransferase [Rhodanobacter panaciterrae]GGY13629.1 thiopurine S-methyltransferase [Rhodanobacter panaciterrae]